MTDKYKMFKQFLYNELEITKDDIKEWTKEAVQEVANDYIKNQFSHYRLEQYMNNIVNSACKKLEWTNLGWKNELEKFVIKQLEVSLCNAIKIAVKEACEL